MCMYPHYSHKELLMKHMKHLFECIEANTIQNNLFNFNISTQRSKNAHIKFQTQQKVFRKGFSASVYKTYEMHLYYSQN